MRLQAGARIGQYEVLSLIGAGGMSEVYRARDTKLNRDVALKVLSEQLAHDAERLARFTREAQTLAALNHPHIAHIYGLEESGEVRALAMELVEGEDLAQRIRRGPILMAAALLMARQIADALEAAHGHGIVHRDLKPANVMVSADGAVKVLDFGLAKALDPTPSSPAAIAPAYPPTLTRPVPTTRAGFVVGTAAYMPPEQATGGPVDKRADIWAFGCVVYELLTGQRAFAGADVSDTLAAVLTKVPDWTALPTDTPVAVRRLLRRSLEKDRTQRLADIADARLEIEDALTAPTRDSMIAVSAFSPARPTGWRRALRWTLAGIVSVGWVVALGLWVLWRTTPAESPQRLSVELGVDGTLATTDAAFALSADGAALAFVAQTSQSAAQLHVRRLDQLTAMALSGTDGASSPFLSPDGQWVAFFADLKLKKIPVTGGAVVTLANAPAPRGGWWGQDGTIIFAPDYRKGLMRVSAVGGDAQPVTTLVGDEITHRWPQVLPGGGAVLYTASTNVDTGAAATLVVQPLPSGERIIIHRGGYFARYVPSGHIVYMHDDAVFVMPFDRKRLAVTGPAARVIEGVRSHSTRGVAQMAVSQVGTFAYVPGLNAFDPRPVAWMDRSGKLATLRAAAADWRNPEFSPDGLRVAMDIRGEGHRDIWVYEWARDTLTRVTSDPGNEERPVWTRDGRRIVYRTFTSPSNASGNTLSWSLADGTGHAQVLIRSTGALTPGSWHPARMLLAYSAATRTSGVDVMTLPIEGDEKAGWNPGQPTALLNSAANERGPTFSPDGKWLAYYSDDSGSNVVYVRPFSRPGGRVIVSSANSNRPAWSRSRRELVFTTAVSDYAYVLMVAPYVVEHDTFRADKPRLWADRGSLRNLEDARIYALHPDGIRVATTPPSKLEAVEQKHVTFVLNFSDELKRVTHPKP
jgi:Tol biopolymer transport system component/tRNA A-37 threonylcarbamoyl transferase component Bud32